MKNIIKKVIWIEKERTEYVKYYWLKIFGKRVGCFYKVIWD